MSQCKELFLVSLRVASGESEIYQTNCPNTLAKVYYPQNLTKEREEKIKAMLKISLPPLVKGRIVWPTDIFYDSNKQFKGYFMPEISDAHSWRRISVPQARRQYGIRLNFKQRMQLCLHLSQLLSQLHENQIVFGDLKPENILVNIKTLEVFLIDTDSCQFQYHQDLWRCPVGTPAYTPPELQNVHFQDIDQLPSHDVFRLAVLCFELLMGHHPFQGKNRDENAPHTNQVENIIHREWVWRRGGKLVPGPNYPPLELLSPALIQKFRQAFELPPEGRPTATEIAGLFQREISQMRSCPNNPNHWYCKHTPHCYWCPIDVPVVKAPSPVAPRICSNTAITQRSLLDFLFNPIQILIKKIKETIFSLFKGVFSVFIAFFKCIFLLIGAYLEQADSLPRATGSASFALFLPLFIYALRAFGPFPDQGWLDQFFSAAGPVLQEDFNFMHVLDVCYKFLTSWTQLIPSTYWWTIVIMGLILSGLTEGMIGAVLLIAALIIFLAHGLLALLAACVGWLGLHIFSLIGFWGLHFFLFGDRVLHALFQQQIFFPWREQLLNSPALCWMIATFVLLPLLIPVAWRIGVCFDEN